MAHSQFFYAAICFHNPLIPQPLLDDAKRLLGQAEIRLNGSRPTNDFIGVELNCVPSATENPRKNSAADNIFPPGRCNFNRRKVPRPVAKSSPEEPAATTVPAAETDVSSLTSASPIFTI